MLPLLLLGLAVAAAAGGGSGGTSKTPGLGLLAPVAVPKKWQILAYLRSRPDLPRLPIYRGFPQNMPIPEGYSPVKVWVTVDGQTYPDPRRFNQFHGLATLDQPERGEMQSRFSKLYWFGVSEGTVLTFYVLGKPAPTEQCCVLVTCGSSSSDSSPGHGSSSEEVYRTDGGGAASDWQIKFGGAMACACEANASECFRLYPAPLADWEQIDYGFDPFEPFDPIPPLPGVRPGFSKRWA